MLRPILWSLALYGENTSILKIACGALWGLPLHLHAILGRIRSLVIACVVTPTAEIQPRARPTTQICALHGFRPV